MAEECCNRNEKEIQKNAMVNQPENTEIRSADDGAIKMRPVKIQRMKV
jgi:hypothetical protein